MKTHKTYFSSHKIHKYKRYGIKNIYETGELRREATVANFATVQMEGDRSVSRELEHYNLDAIISVGYRVNSIRGTQFRIWATERLKEYNSLLDQIPTTETGQHTG